MPAFTMDSVPTPVQPRPRRVGYDNFAESDYWDVYRDGDPYYYGGTGTSEDVNPNEGSK